MISSIKSKCREVAAIVPVKRLTGDDLSKMTKKVLTVLHQSGFTVRIISADNSKVNRSAFELLCDGTLKIHIPHPLGPGRLYFMFDTVHLMKCIRNNWLAQGDVEKTFKFPPLAFVEKDFQYLPLPDVLSLNSSSRSIEQRHPAMLQFLNSRSSSSKKKNK